jgi:cysteine-rich secretory family protein
MVLATKPNRAPNIQHKKRSGLHHKQDERYHKPYWPYLPLLAIVGLGIIFNGVWAQHLQSVLGDTTGISTSQLLSDTNVQRSADNEKNLTLNNELSAAAQAKANDMVKRNYWSHNTPDNKTPWSFITAAGYPYQTAGENLAYGFTSSNALMNGWMNSAEHRGNILDTSYTNVGFGIAQSPNFQNSGPETVVVAMYAEPAANVTTVSAQVVGTHPAPVQATVVQPPAAKVSRLQIISSNTPLSAFVVSSLCAILMLIFFVRHGLFLRRAFARSEAFVVHHRLLDVLLVSVTTLGIVLTRTAGFIH